MGDLTWLAVGGCPRSGTTALGEVLNGHPEVALLHEYDQAHFFATVDAFFREETRLDVYVESKDIDLIPRRNRHALGVVRALMREFTGKDAQVIGTKFPGVHLWPQPRIPEGILHKEIHITRAPHAVVTSYAKKMLREGYPGGHAVIMDTAIAHWISAWNYAVSRRDDHNFLHVLYERLGTDREIGWKIARFLGIEGGEHFDFSSYRSKNKDIASYRDELLRAGFGEQIDRFNALIAYAEWERWAPEAYAAGTRIGFPVRAGERIDLRGEFGGWKYPLEGFYPMEREGRWLKGKGGGIDLIPMFEAPQGVMLAVDIPWVFAPGGAPAILEIGIDGGILARTPMNLGDNNGSVHHFYWLLEKPLVYGRTIRLDIRALNPRNPKNMGLSQDDRDLSVLLQSLTLSPI